MSDRADQPSQYDEPEIRRHPLAPTFDEAAADESGYETLVGFMGDSPREGRVRVYFDLTFRSYCEVDTADIRHTKPLDPADDNGAAVVVVRADADLEYVRVDRVSGSASFVSGAIRARHYATGDDTSFWAGDLESVEEFGVHPPITPSVYCTSRVFPPCAPGPPPVSRVLACAPLPPIPISRVFTC